MSEYSEYPLIYADPRLTDAEIASCLKTAWEIIYEIEYDHIFQAFNGIYLDEERNQIEITFGLASGSLANVAMLCIDRETGDSHFDWPAPERVEQELAMLSQIMGTDVLEWEREQRKRLVEHLTTGEAD